MTTIRGLAGVVSVMWVADCTVDLLGVGRRNAASSASRPPLERSKIPA